MNFFEPENLRTHTAGRWRQRPGSAISLDGIGIDSRDALTNKAFLAINGEHHDGHDYLPQAVEAGADLLIVQRDMQQCELPPNVGVLQVHDCRTALAQLALAYRQKLRQAQVIAITGSAGKTTVKQLIDAVLSTSMRGSVAPRSYNNDIGVPLTILGADVRDEYLILEIGANQRGEVDQLAAIAQPDVGVITSIGRAHLAGFGSIETVAREKAALLRYLRPNHVAVVNADSHQLRRHLSEAESVVLFGNADDADLRLTARGADQRGWWFEINGTDRFRLGLPGRHNALNAVAAVAVGRRLGVPDGLISTALAGCEPVHMRMSCHEIGEIVVYNDAYNANPDSVIASLETFAELASKATRRILVLGDMLELGEGGPQLHREIGQRVVDLGRRVRIDHVVLIGPLAALVAEPIGRSWAPERLMMFSELTVEVAVGVTGLLRPGDAVLLKGSRAVALERVMDAVKQRHERPDELAHAPHGEVPRCEAISDGAI